MTVLKSSTIIVLIRASFPEPRAAAEIARGGLPTARLRVRSVSSVLRLFTRRNIVLKSRTVNLRETIDHPTR